LIAAAILGLQRLPNDVRKNAPVFITDRGKPGHALLSIEDCQRLVGGQHKMADGLAMPSAEDVGFEVTRANISIRLADHS
jgi:hypothetical protein